MSETPNERAKRLRQHSEFAKVLYRDTEGPDTFLDRAVLGSLLELIDADIETVTWGMACPTCAKRATEEARMDPAITSPLDRALAALKAAYRALEEDNAHHANHHLTIAMGHVRLAIDDDEDT